MSGPVDGLSVIARWTIYVCPICGHAGATNVCAGPDNHHELVSRESGKVEVVPADQLKGAVSALEEIRDTVRMSSVKQHAADRCEAIAVAALNSLRGR